MKKKGKKQNEAFRGTYFLKRREKNLVKSRLKSKGIYLKKIITNDILANESFFYYNMEPTSLWIFSSHTWMIGSVLSLRYH